MNGYLIFVLVLLAGSWLLDLVVETLNLRHVSEEVPAEFAEVYDAATYAKSQRYLRDNTHFALVQQSVMLALTLAFILLGGFGWLQRVATGAAETMIIQGLVFAGILMLLGQLVGLPFALYDTFVLEARYGFNRTTAKTFVLDLLKGLALTCLLGAPVFALILWIFSSLAYAWLWAWAATALIQLFLLLIAPVVILPLFNKFTPLEPGDLREQIERYAAGQQYRIRGIFQIDGSRRSTKSNAYFTGIGRTKRIALFDTLMEKHSTDELLCVLAHEVGHCKRGHIRTQLMLSLAVALLMFALLAFFLQQPGLYAAFQVEGMPLYAGFVLFGFLYAPVSMLLGLAGNELSRRHEYQADAFAAETTGMPEKMIKALKKLSVDNLSNLTPHPAKVFFSYSHPPVLQRIRALREQASGKPL